jgi:TolB-like protein
VPRALALLMVVALAASWAGCAARTSPARRLLNEGEYAAAERALRAQLARAPDDDGVAVDLAEALYQQERLDVADSLLTEVRGRSPEHAGAILLTGLVHEKRGDLDAAIDAYRSYAQLSRLGRSRGVIKARLDRLIRERIDRQTQAALQREEMLDPADIPDNTVAVAPFTNLGGNEDLAPLRKGLAEMMVTDLSKVPGLQVLERLQMQAMMREIGLGQTGAVDPATAPRLGKLLGASRVVAGTFTDLADEQLRLDISVSRVKEGATDQAEVAGPLADLFRLQKDLTFGVIDEMGIELTAEQRDAIEEIPTENLLAFMAYARGLDLEDQGETQAAAAAFREASQLDPGFTPAAESVERVEAAAVSVAAGGVEAVEDAVLGSEVAGDEVAVDDAQGTTNQESGDGDDGEIDTSVGSLSRLGATGANAGAGFVPSGPGTQSDVRRPAEEQAGTTPQTVRIRVDARIP